MSKIEELQKRVERLEIEVELLKELIKLVNKSKEEWYKPTSHPHLYNRIIQKSRPLNHRISSLVKEVKNEN